MSCSLDCVFIGNCRTVMIANVSPCHLTYEETHNTLKVQYMCYMYCLLYV